MIRNFNGNETTGSRIFCVHYCINGVYEYFFLYQIYFHIFVIMQYVISKKICIPLYSYGYENDLFNLFLG